MQVLQSQPNLIEVEQTLSKNAYFSRSSLPGFADAVIFKFLAESKKYPDKKKYPNFYHWYIIMRQFSESAFEGWIRQKRYIDNQSEKCIMLISQIFMKQNRHVLKQTNRKKSLDSVYHQQKKDKTITESQKLKPLDLNFPQSNLQKAEYSMIVQLRSVQNLQELFNKFYKFKQIQHYRRIRIKQLKYHKKQRSIFLKFITQINSFDQIKNEIEDWNEVRHVIHKMSKTLNDFPENKRILRVGSIR